MEKSTPHCKLTVVKALLQDGKFRVTRSARTGAEAMGIDFQGMLTVISALQASDFYKSMTTHADHTIWQDVYRTSSPLGDVYLKLTVVDDLLIVSFKEL
ncbi:mRNA interferase MqsR [Acidovorax carolinensis]|uniref:mRNA interferase MqsR n=1 Tax=Acidovorax carolinensis TaxID=553814 RepID=A0A240U2Z1_9BURK|nr:type II toxin-antitoxin system MqsR family toxin [Acidovorax carolinensis]ART52206.1 mRNA interferase MqsR [Acidovorax carolinensis]